MSILITGGAGYIGSHMAHELADAGERVVVLDDFSTGFDWAIPVGVPLVVGERRGRRAHLLLPLPRTVYPRSCILPLPSSFQKSVIDPLPYYRNNTMNSRNLIAAALSGGVKQFIFSSTAAVYGNAGDKSRSRKMRNFSPYRPTAARS